MLNKILKYTCIAFGIIIVGGSLYINQLNSKYYKLQSQYETVIHTPPTYIKGKDSVITKTKYVIVDNTKPAEITDSTMSASFDTTVVANKDTAKIHSSVIANLIDKTINLVQSIDFRSYETIRVDTLEHTVIQQVEVPVEPPFYKTFTAGFAVGIAFVVAVAHYILGVL